MNLKKCHQWLLQKQFVTKKDFVTAIGDIFTHVTAIADPWVGNGCHKGAHTPETVTLRAGEALEERLLSFLIVAFLGL